MVAASLERKEHCLLIKGKLDFDTMVRLHQQGSQWIQQGVVSIVDLQAVEHSTSAGVALLLDWFRIAKQQKLSLYFMHLPKQMRAMVEVFGLTDILPMSDNNECDSITTVNCPTSTSSPGRSNERR